MPVTRNSIRTSQVVVVLRSAGSVIRSMTIAEQEPKILAVFSYSLLQSWPDPIASLTKLGLKLQLT